MIPQFPSQSRHIYHEVHSRHAHSQHDDDLSQGYIDDLSADGDMMQQSS